MTFSGPGCALIDAYLIDNRSGNRVFDVPDVGWSLTWSRLYSNTVDDVALVLDASIRECWSLNLEPYCLTLVIERDGKVTDSYLFERVVSTSDGSLSLGFVSPLHLVSTAGIWLRDVMFEGSAASAFAMVLREFAGIDGFPFSLENAGAGWDVTVDENQFDSMGETLVQLVSGGVGYTEYADDGNVHIVRFGEIESANNYVITAKDWEQIPPVGVDGALAASFVAVISQGSEGSVSGVWPPLDEGAGVGEDCRWTGLRRVVPDLETDLDAVNAARRLWMDRRDGRFLGSVSGDDNNFNSRLSKDFGVDVGCLLPGTLMPFDFEDSGLSADGFGRLTGLNFVARDGQEVSVSAEYDFI